MNRSYRRAASSAAYAARNINLLRQEIHENLDPRQAEEAERDFARILKSSVTPIIITIMMVIASTVWLITCLMPDGGYMDEKTHKTAMPDLDKKGFWFYGQDPDDPSKEKKFRYDYPEGITDDMVNGLGQMTVVVDPETMRVDRILTRKNEMLPITAVFASMIGGPIWIITSAIIKRRKFLEKWGPKLPSYSRRCNSFFG